MKAQFVKDYLFEFERWGEENAIRGLRIGLSEKPMKERSPEFNFEDRKRALEYLESTGLIKAAPMSKTQEKNLTLKLQLTNPYWYIIGSSYSNRKKEAGMKTKGTMYYFIQRGYLRKFPPGADRLQVITRDHYATYLDLAKILVEKAKKDIKKSDDIKNSDIPIATISENMNFKRGGLDTRTDALDRILDRNITIQLTANILDINEKGRLVMGQSPDTDHFIRVLRKSGVRWKILNPGNFPVEFEFTGSKKELVPVISEWDAYDRSKKDLMKALENWNGDEEELWDIIS